MNDKAINSEDEVGAPPKGEVAVVSTESEARPVEKGAVPQEKRKATSYVASVYSGPPGSTLPNKLVSAVKSLEQSLEMSIWLLVQKGRDQENFGGLDENLFYAFLAAKKELPKGKPVALLVDSPGGHARSAYRIAMLLRKHCGGFITIVPRAAKSAATLLSLGADSILLGRHGELGPLDAQYMDPEREGVSSALDEVQALERLHASAMEAVDRSMLLLLARTGKKIESLLPVVLKFVSDMMRPLFEKIDAVQYTQRSRALKVAEEYAVRLLRPRYTKEDAESIARKLVEAYPDHGFVIDASESASIGLDVMEPTEDQYQHLDDICMELKTLTAIGFIREAEGA